MVRVERTITIESPLADVYAYLRDLEHLPQYVSAQRAARQTSAGPITIGTPFVTTSSKFPHRDAAFEIIEYEPGRRLAWKSLSGAPTTTTWSFQPAGPNTRISFTRVAEASWPPPIARVTGPRARK